MSTSQSLPAQKEHESLKLILDFWGGKNSVMGGGLLAEAFMWPKKYDSMCAARRSKRDAKRAAMAVAEGTKSIHQEIDQHTAEAQANDPKAEGSTGPIKEGSQGVVAVEGEVQATISADAEGKVQPQNPATPAPMKAPSIKSQTANETEDAHELVKSLAAPVPKAPSVKASITKSNAGSDHSSKSDVPEKPSTVPVPLEAPSVKDASAKLAFASSIGVEETAVQCDKEASTQDKKDGSAKQPDSAPRLRGGGPPSTSHTSSQASKQGSIGRAKPSVPGSTKDIPPQGKETSHHKPPSLSRSTQQPSQPQLSTRPRSTFSTPSVAPTIPQLNFSRTHSVRAESSLSVRGEADPPAPSHDRITLLGQHWLNKRPVSSDSGYKQASSKASNATPQPNISKWIDGQSQRQRPMTSQQATGAVGSCKSCGRPTNCELCIRDGTMIPPPQKTSSANSHAASQKPTPAQPPPRPSNQTQSRPVKQPSHHSSLSPGQIEAVKPPSQYDSKSHKTLPTAASDHSKNPRNQAKNAPNKQPSASKSPTRSQPPQSPKAPSQHPSQTQSAPPQPTKPLSQAPSASKSHKPSQAGSNHTQNKISIPRSSTSQHTAVLPVHNIHQQAQHSAQAAVVHYPPSQQQAPPRQTPVIYPMDPPSRPNPRPERPCRDNWSTMANDGHTRLRGGHQSSASTTSSEPGGVRITWDVGSDCGSNAGGRDWLWTW